MVFQDSYPRNDLSNSENITIRDEYDDWYMSYTSIAEAVSKSNTEDSSRNKVWRLPTPTSQTDLTPHIPIATTYYEQINSIKNKLSDSDYETNLHIVKINNGYAIVTFPEQFSEDGTTIGDGYRYKKEVKRTLWNFFYYFLKGPKVKLRVFVFTITNTPAIPGTQIKYLQEFEQSISVSLKGLPSKEVFEKTNPNLTGKPAHVEVFIYEFLWNEDISNYSINGELILEPSLRAKEHLTASHLWEKVIQE